MGQGCGAKGQTRREAGTQSHGASSGARSAPGSHRGLTGTEWHRCDGALTEVTGPKEGTHVA